MSILQSAIHCAYRPCIRELTSYISSLYPNYIRPHCIRVDTNKCILFSTSCYCLLTKTKCSK